MDHVLVLSSESIRETSTRWDIRGVVDSGMWEETSLTKRLYIHWLKSTRSAGQSVSAVPAATECRRPRRGAVTGAGVLEGAVWRVSMGADP